MIEATPILPAWLAWVDHWLSDAGQIAVLAALMLRLYKEIVRRVHLEKRLKKLEEFMGRHEGVL